MRLRDADLRFLCLAACAAAASARCSGVLAALRHHQHYTSVWQSWQASHALTLVQDPLMTPSRPPNIVW